MPAIIMVIIQQTLLIGIGMIGGTWREFGLYRKLCPPDRKRMSTLPIVLGKATVYGLIYGVTTFYILGLHYRLFHYPMNGATSTVVVFMLAYLAACIFLGIAISTLFRYRENSLLLLLWTSIPLLMLSGVSYPARAFPTGCSTSGSCSPAATVSTASSASRAWAHRSARCCPKSGCSASLHSSTAGWPASAFTR